MEDKHSLIMLWSTECFHKLHKDCFTKYAFNQIKNNASVVCPNSKCKLEVDQKEITEYMTRKEIEEFT